MPDESPRRNPSNVKTVAVSHPLAITRLLLRVALCPATASQCRYEQTSGNG